MSTPRNDDDIPFEDRTYEVFNSRRTIGVRTRHGGALAGLYLSEDVRKTTERALARDILAVVAVASARGRLSLREQVDAAAANVHTQVNPALDDVLPDVPTRQQYEEFKRKTLP